MKLYSLKIDGFRGRLFRYEPTGESDTGYGIIEAMISKTGRDTGGK